MIPLSFKPTQQELLFADRVLSKANHGIKGEQLITTKLDADSAVDILLGTKLSPKTLSWIWSEADIGGKGYLSRQEVCAALRIIGWVQSGKKASADNLLEQAGPQAFISGFDSDPQDVSASPPPPKPSLLSFPSHEATVEDLARFKALPQSPTSDSSSSSPPIIPSPSSRVSVTRADTEAWKVSSVFLNHAHKLFDVADRSQQGSIHTNEVLPLFQKSNLPVNQLSAIWSLLGVKEPGQVTKDNFVGAIFLVYRCFTGLELPETLPELFATAFATPPAPPADPFSNVSSSSSVDEEDEVGGLYAQIQALQDALLKLGQENDDLRSSVQTLHRVSRQHTQTHNRMSRNVDVGLTEIARLQIELQEKDSALTRLRASLQVTEDLSRENTILRLEIEDLRTQLEVSRGEAAAQTLVAEELVRESDRLKRQVDEFRETSTQVPSVSGDQELQNLINEDLSRENSRLRTQARELQDAIAQLRVPSEEMNSLKESTRRLTQANRLLHRRLREMESSASAQDELRRRVEDLNRQNERLQRDLQQTRRRSSSNRQNSTDLPPPAYTEVAR